MVNMSVFPKKTIMFWFCILSISKVQVCFGFIYCVSPIYKFDFVEYVEYLQNTIISWLRLLNIFKIQIYTERK